MAFLAGPTAAPPARLARVNNEPGFVLVSGST